MRGKGRLFACPYPFTESVAGVGVISCGDVGPEQGVCGALALVRGETVTYGYHHPALWGIGHELRDEHVVVGALSETYPSRLSRILIETVTKVLILALRA
jgi:hypothetical protein